MRANQVGINTVIIMITKETYNKQRARQGVMNGITQNIISDAFIGAKTLSYDSLFCFTKDSFILKRSLTKKPTSQPGLS